MQYEAVNAKYENKPHSRGCETTYCYHGLIGYCSKLMNVIIIL